MNSNTLQEAREIAARRRDLSDWFKRVLIERLSLQLEPEEIANDSPLFGSGLGLDSVDALEIAIAVETEFGVSITDEDLHAFRSVNTVLDFIEERMPENV
ncbi:MAG: acyl carrier protein [Proteobacteria bacterium]|nr:acyl carrier protein [Desulfocapsa sp.]MBU4030527.1 acyl carrier protein [Pseudomonadota bacterium]MBU4044697.1 acyl carrier protein [Pseudomonadota bacterium]